MSSLHEGRCSLQRFLTGQIQQLRQKEHVASETELKVSFFFFLIDLLYFLMSFF